MQPGDALNALNQITADARHLDPNQMRATAEFLFQQVADADGLGKALVQLAVAVERYRLHVPGVCVLLRMHTKPEGA